MKFFNTSESCKVQFLKSALIEPNMIINKTTIKLTPVNKLFILDDSLTPIAKIPLIERKISYVFF